MTSKRDIPRAPAKFAKKMFVFNFRTLFSHLAEKEDSTEIGLRFSAQSTWSDWPNLIVWRKAEQKNQKITQNPLFWNHFQPWSLATVQPLGFLQRTLLDSPSRAAKNERILGNM